MRTGVELTGSSNISYSFSRAVIGLLRARPAERRSDWDSQSGHSVRRGGAIEKASRASTHTAGVSADAGATPSSSDMAGGVNGFWYFLVSGSDIHSFAAIVRLWAVGAVGQLCTTVPVPLPLPLPSPPCWLLSWQSSHS
eukprot:COSAG01_NODE_1466_length_10220_cov_15.883608_3_plen_139_part_00